MPKLILFIVLLLLVGPAWGQTTPAAAETPEMLVQRQVDAYNARDIDAFMATYADDIELVSNCKVDTKGKEAMRKTYADLFAKTPNLHCKIENRIVINNKVIDKENVQAGTRTIHAVAIYEVENQKIKRVTFVW